VGLDHNTGAVVKDGRRGDLGREEKVHVGFLALGRGRGVHGTLDSTRAVLFLDLFSNSLQFVASVFGYNLHTNANVGHHVLGGLGGSAVVLLEETSSSSWSESAHLHLTDHESISVEVVNNFTSVHVSVGLDQQER
jgi:hypothetical protein